MLLLNMLNNAGQPTAGDILWLWAAGLSAAGKLLAMLAILGLFAFGRVRFISDRWVDRCRRWIRVLAPPVFRIGIGIALAGALLSAATLVADPVPAASGACLLGWGILLSGSMLVWQNILCAWPTGPQSGSNATPAQAGASRAIDELARPDPQSGTEVWLMPWQLQSQPAFMEIGVISFVGVTMLTIVYSLSFLWAGASLPFISTNLHRVWNPGQMQRVLAGPLPIGGIGAGGGQSEVITAGNSVHLRVVAPHLPKWIQLAPLLPPEGHAGNCYREAVESKGVIWIPSGLFWAARATQLGYWSLAIGLIGWLGTWTMRLIFASAQMPGILAGGPGKIARIRPLGLSGLPPGLAWAITAALLATFCSGLFFLLLPFWAGYQLMQNGLVHAAITGGSAALVPMGYLGLLLLAETFRAGMVGDLGARKGGSEELDVRESETGP